MKICLAVVKLFQAYGQTGQMGNQWSFIDASKGLFLLIVA
jgi:hypothetical protein